VGSTDRMSESMFIRNCATAAPGLADRRTKRDSHSTRRLSLTALGSTRSISASLPQYAPMLSISASVIVVG
jgi:hypothetical protein